MIPRCAQIKDVLMRNPIQIPGNPVSILNEHRLFFFFWFVVFGWLVGLFFCLCLFCFGLQFYICSDKVKAEFSLWKTGSG